MRIPSHWPDDRIGPADSTFCLALSACLIVLAALIASPARAQDVTVLAGDPVILAPAWSAQPTGQAITNARPPGMADFPAFVVLRCVVADDGGLTGCSVVREEPVRNGVGTAALSLAGQYRTAKPAGRQVMFPVVFNSDRPRLDQTASGDEGILRRLALALTRPQRSDPSLTILTCQVQDDGVVAGCQTAYETQIDPDLAAYQIAEARAEVYAPATRPHPQGYQTIYRVMTDNTDRAEAELINAPTLDAFYPATAKGRISGQVQLSCTITTAGLAKDCQIRSELPGGQGFANAALEYAGRSTFSPKHIDGVDVEGSRTLDIRLEPGQEEPAPDQAPAQAAAPETPASAPVSPLILTPAVANGAP